MKPQGTLSNIARRCSVSESTVSRVLNNSTAGRFSASKEVRERILKVAGELNYRPSIAARNLSSTKSHLVAVLGIDGLWTDRIGPAEEAVAALAPTLDEAGYEICMQFISNRHSAFDPPGLRVDGVVAVGPRNDSDIEALERIGVPYVSVNGVVGRRGSSVRPDDRLGTRLALEHLVELGHRKIAYLDHASVDADHPSVADRRDAFAQAQAELAFDSPKLDLPLLGRKETWDNYYEPFLRAAVQRGGATAVLAYSHHAAIAVLRTAHEIGLSAPRDFSLICFNNEPMVRLTVPSLTAVDVPASQMGYTAARLLLDQMAEGEADAEHVVLDESLVVRESTAPPRAR